MGNDVAREPMHDDRDVTAKPLRDEATVWTVTLPAGTMEVKKPGSSYSYKDKTGALAGLTGLSIKISKGTAKIMVKAQGLVLSGVARAALTLSLDFVSGTYSSTARRRFGYKEPKLSTES